jgi:hypothetical protein
LFEGIFVNEFLNFFGKASHIENNVDEEDLKNEDDLKGEGQEMMDDEGSGEVFGKKSEFDQEDLKGTGSQGVRWLRGYEVTRVTRGTILMRLRGSQGVRGLRGYEVTRVTRGTMVTRLRG